MAGMTEKQAEPLDLVYGLEDKPPFGNALLSAVTHLLAIFVPMITPALIVGGALELPVEMTAYLVSMAMVALGVGTYLQVNRFGPVGSGMLSIQSVNFSFVAVMIALGTGMKEGSLTEDAMISTLLGVSFVGAFLVCFSAWLLPYLKKVITPTVSGVVVMLIGLSLVHVGITDFGGGFGAKADGTFGSMENLGLASLVLLIVFMITMPVLTHSIPLELPTASEKAAKEDKQQPKDPLRLSIDASGAYVVGGDSDTKVDLATVTAKLKEAKAKNEDVIVAIAADKAVEYDYVNQALQAAREAGISKIGFVTETKAQ